MSKDKKVAGSSGRTLRSVPQSDLTIVLGVEGNETRSHNSYMLAFHSEYVDTMLANDMTESKSRRLSFPDIEPSQWDLMMSLLEVKGAIRTVTVDEVLTILPFYEKYQFHAGKATWDRFLSDHLEHLDNDKDFDAIIDLTAFAIEHNLESTMKAGADFLHNLIKANLHVRLTYSHIEKVLFLFYSDAALSKVFEGCTLDKDFVLSPCFSNFVSQHVKLAGIDQIIKPLLPKCIEGKSGTTSSTQKFQLNMEDNGDYTGSGYLKGYGSSWTLTRQGGTIDWTIFADYNTNTKTGKKLWIRPGSFNMPCPPRKGWKPCCDEAEKTLVELKYKP